VRTALQNPVRQNHRHDCAVRSMVGTGVPLHGLVVSAGCGTVLWRAGACGDRAGGIAGAVARWSGGCLRCAAAECGVAGADDGGGAERDAACCAPSAGGAACWCGLMERWPAPGCLVQPLFAACRLMVAASLLPCLLSCLASPRVKIGGMRAGGAGLRRMRAVWGLHPGRPCSAGACVPEPRGSAAPCKGGLCAGHVQQLGGESPLYNLMEVKYERSARAEPRGTV